MNEREHEAYLKALTGGFQAGIDGLDPRLCPYDKLTREWSTWLRWHGRGINHAHGVNIDDPPNSGCAATILGTHD